MGQFEEIDTQKAKELIDQGNITIVDIRDTSSFEEGHIENAVSVNDTNIEEFVNSADKNQPVLCYCYMGFSSRNAAQYFKEQGFETVYSMTGGFTEWQRVNENSGESFQEG
jgi:thiosulfate sulfurtransferase